MTDVRLKRHLELPHIVEPSDKPEIVAIKLQANLDEMARLLVDLYQELDKVKSRLEAGGL